MENISFDDIVEIWHIVGVVIPIVHYVVLLLDGSHKCTCMFLINRGIVCKHFFQVMLLSPYAKFHIALISARWYQDSKQQISYDNLLSNYSCISLKNTSNITPLIENVSMEFNLKYLKQFKVDNSTISLELNQLN